PEEGPDLRLDRPEGARRRDPRRVLPGHALHDHLRGRRGRALRDRMSPQPSAQSPARPRPAVGADLHPAVLVPGLKRLLKGSWEVRTWFILAVLGAIVFAVLQIATSSIIGRVTEEVIVPSFAAGEARPALLAGGG